MSDLDAELDALFAAPLAEFTKRRNELERKLHAAGQTELAASVRARPKPTLPAWIVNQLARRDPAAMRALTEAAEQVAAAQTGGETSGPVADAAAAHREAVRMVTASVSKLEAPRLSQDVRQRVSSALRNTSLDPASRDELLRGRLTAEQEATGFDALASLAPASRRAPRRDGSDDEKRKQELARLTERRTEARDALAAVRSEHAEAKREATRTRREAERAEARVGKLAGELRDKEAAAEELTRELQMLRRRRS